jgi:histidyl-tRNA synthetase
MKDVSGIGVSFGFDRIYLILEQLNLFPVDIEKKTQILFLNSGTNSVDFALSILSKLRTFGLICELYPSEIKMSKQLNYANKKDVSYVVILGDDEFKNKNFTLKKMISGEQNEYPLIDIQKILEKLF